MVAIIKDNDNFIFEVQGAHKLWAFKNQITIPAKDIVRAHQNIDALPTWKGFRMPGTSIPFVLTAGTYYRGGKKDFWDVVNKEKCIIIELKDADYNQLIIEVENPEATLALLNQ